MPPLPSPICSKCNTKYCFVRGPDGHPRSPLADVEGKPVCVVCLSKEELRKYFPSNFCPFLGGRCTHPNGMTSCGVGSERSCSHNQPATAPAVFRRIYETWVEDTHDTVGNPIPRGQLFIVTSEGEVAVYQGHSIPTVLQAWRTPCSHDHGGAYIHTFELNLSTRLVLVLPAETPLTHDPFASFNSWMELQDSFEKAAGTGVQTPELIEALEEVYPEACEALHDRQRLTDERDLFSSKPVKYICNAFSLSMVPTNCLLAVREVSLEDAIVSCKEAISAVGHPDTARLFSTILGRIIENNRISITLEREDVVLVGQYSGPRLSEGATELPEGASIKWLRVEVC